MKHLYALLLLIVIFSNPCFSQLRDDDPQCREKCSHGSLSSRTQQAAFYQYPSMANYDIKYLKLDLDVTAGNLFISGTALTVAKVVQTMDSFNIELRDNMTVDSVYINGTRRNFGRGSDHIFVPLSPALPIGSTVSALFYFNGNPSNGVYAEVNSNDLTFTATLSESYQAREWYPAKQILSDKIDSADIWVKTDAINKVGSNGKLVAVVDSPNNKKQYQWKSRYPMNYYMPSIAVGDYLEYSIYAKPAAMAPDSIQVLNYIWNDATYFNSVKTNLDKTPAFIEKFSELFGLYPFKDEKYGHSHAYIGGGMEHQTMTTMSSFGSTVIAHELGHQWWGDHVTCATWNHIWLNEGFASYCEYLAIENLPALFPTTNPSTYMQNIHTSVMSSPTGSVFVPNASIFDENRIFSGRLSYNKGSAIIHNLRFEMEDDNLFFQTLKNYQVQFANSVATADDFKQVAEITSGKDFTDFFNQWYYGEGYPTFNVTYLMQGVDSIILQINETVSAASVTPFFKGLYEFTIKSAQGDTVVKVHLDSNNQLFKFKYTKIPNGIIVDPNNWVLNKTGTITNGGIVVVGLVDFETNEQDCIAALKWKMSSEQNISKYEVEYSTDGINYSTIATINSTNSNSETTHEYNYSFESGQLHYFRLKIINANGSYVYSQVTSITKNCAGSFSIDIKPNPVSGILYLSVTQPADGNTSIKIFDSHGALMYKGSPSLIAGENKIQIPVQSFAKGTYILRAVNSNTIIDKKFVKL